MGGQVVSFTAARTLSFVDRLKTSGAFKDLFREGMAMVEESAAYLDGPGRDEAKALLRAPALAYATESMRLTTRLMQMASWLLLQRAVNEGEMSQTQAAAEKHKVRLSRLELAAQSDIYDQLPERLRELCERSLRLQSRIIHLDGSIYAKTPPVSPEPQGVEAQFARLRAAFGPRREGVPQPN